ncbi:hypothetical protein BBJ28_00009188 [Nothophytophthora sp. Chile5]|nr:hypothetical protein BBJ28_00009188 [Nothophytophthora sp. Chile5]
MTPTQSRRFEYAQALAKAQAQSDSGEKSPGGMSAMAGDGSFMQSLMTNQDPTFAYDQGNNSQQQQQPQQNASNQDMDGATGEQLGPVPPVTSAISQGFSPSAFQSGFSAMQGQGVPRNAMEAQQQQQVQFNMQQQQQPGQQRSQQRASTLLEFSAQVQHFDKTMLVELLWNQRNALAQWQRRANQLEYQLVALRNATNGMGSPGLRPPYYNVSPAGVNPYVSSNVTVEAEMQRARERNSMRVALQLPQQQQQQPYPHQQRPQYGGNNAVSSPVGTNGVNSVASAMNPGVYWEKIRVLKAAHAGELCLAHRALTHHNAPPNSVHSIKAQSVKNNIALVLNILNEPVKNLQPRSFDVLASIERFIQTTVIPIVRKVQSSGMMSQAQSTALTSGYESTAMSGSGTATTSVTHAPNVQSSHENLIGGGSDANGGAENQLPGGRWSSPNSFIIGGSALPLASRPPPAESKQAFQNVAENDGSDSRMGPPKGMMGQQAATVGYQLNRPESSYMSSRLGNDGAMAAIQMGSRQTNGSMDQNSAYGATAALKAPSIPTMPPSEPRPPAFAEPLPSSKANSSSSDATGNPNKLVQPPSGIDDSLNDFSDFPELDFDDALQESLAKGGSQFVKENNPVNVAKKRGIEDV